MSEFDTTHYQSRHFRVGSFRCQPSHPRFPDTGPIENYLFVFPRTSVRITHAGRQAVVADANVVMFYNQHQEYRRGPISREGDQCDWFTVSPDAVVEATRPFDPAVVDRPHRPFVFSHGPCDADIYLKQRILLEHVRAHSRPESLLVEESVQEILRGVIAASYEARGHQACSNNSATRRTHAELADAARSLLAESYCDSLSLHDIAHRLHTSPYHLSRVFRQQTGSTLHAYRNQLRLRASLERVTEPRQDLSALAFDLGYSGHSHFTQSFKRCFGVTPSGLRRDPKTAVRDPKTRVRSQRCRSSL